MPLLLRLLPVLALSVPALAAPPPAWLDQLAARPPTAANAPESSAAAQRMRLVPAGRYLIGRDDGPAAERPAHTLALPGFAIDATEVTNDAFAEFLDALDLALPPSAPAGGVDARHLPPAARALLIEGAEGSGQYPIIALDDDQARIGIAGGRFVPAAGFAQHPVTETTWAGALAYCRWRGARLPTEAEWEAAARGADARPWPWGSTPPDDARAHRRGGNGETRPVGSLPAGASAIGALDMAGSLAEWTSTLRRPYPYRADDGREDAAAQGERVTRGGDHRYDRRDAALRTTHRVGFSNAPERGHRHIGFRCAAGRAP
jgi:iron(II)-dependent oxidoreductase